MSGATKAPVEREADEVHPIILMQIIAPLDSESVLSPARLATLTGIVRRDGNAGAASVVALDINPAAAKVAAENAHANGLGKPIIAVGSNLLSALSPRPLFDVILSSPPSFAGEPLDVADRAWHAGPSYRDIAMLFIQARERLTSGGCMYVLFSTESDLDLLGSPAVRRHCRYPNLVRAAPPICPDIIFGKDREIIVKYAASLGKKIKAELQATGCVGGSSRICPSISVCETPRSDRKRGLAKLRLDDGLLRGCSTRAGRQLQHCRALAIAQARD